MIISIKSSASGGSSRGLVHYLAHSKLDQVKEGVERREFFNESEDNLDVRRANENLSLEDVKPKPEELLHIVISPSKEEIEKLGEGSEAQKDGLKEVVRETVAELQKQVKAKNLKWISVAHFNTDNPHAHLAVQKQFTNENGKLEILRINRQMLYYNERSETGEKKLHKGALILAAENKINDLAEERQKHRETEKNLLSEKVIVQTKTHGEDFNKTSSDKLLKIPNYRERRILAEEMLMTSEIARRERNIENLIEHGDKKRFKIKDERTETVRHVSLFDIERKIESVSRHKAWVAHPQNAEKREQFAESISYSIRAEHEPLIKQLETIRRHVLGFENRHLTEAREKHTQLQNQKLLIEKKYERSETKVPLPLFKADEIQKLQSEAVREQDLEKILFLENIRSSNALELNRPSRRNSDVRELLAERIIAKLKTQAAEKRLVEFSENKDFSKIKIGNSLWSHHGLREHERQATQKNDFWTQVKSKTSKILFRSGKRSATSEKLDYPAFHQEITDALEKQAIVQRTSLVKQKEFTQTLDKIFDSETNPHKTKLTPAFSAFELAVAEDLAHAAGNENFYENSLVFQEKWLRVRLAAKINQTKIPNETIETGEITTQSHSELLGQEPSEKIIGSFVLGRASARSLLAQTKVNQATENLARYERGKQFIKHRIFNPKTGAEVELSLSDVEPKKHYYLLDSILERAFEPKEQKDLRGEVHQVAQNRAKELLQNLKAAQNLASRLEGQKTAMFEKFPETEGIQPIFTPKEMSALDAWKDQTANKSEADQLEKIINESEKNGRVERIQESLERAAKTLEILAPNLAKNEESKISWEGNLTEEQKSIGLSQEISNNNATLVTGTNDHPLEVKTDRQENMVVKEKGRMR